jgi:hypothetical protein
VEASLQLATFNSVESRLLEAPRPLRLRVDSALGPREQHPARLLASSHLRSQNLLLAPELLQPQLQAKLLPQPQLRQLRPHLPRVGALQGLQLRSLERLISGLASRQSLGQEELQPQLQHRHQQQLASVGLARLQALVVLEFPSTNRQLQPLRLLQLPQVLRHPLLRLHLLVPPPLLLLLQLAVSADFQALVVVLVVDSASRARQERYQCQRQPQPVHQLPHLLLQQLAQAPAQPLERQDQDSIFPEPRRQLQRQHLRSERLLRQKQFRQN